MSIDNREPGQFTFQVYDVDIKGAYDTEDEISTFITALKERGIYKQGLLFSGFDGNMIGKQFYSDRPEGNIFCSTEKELLPLSDEPSAFIYALDYENPAIAIYDPQKMKNVGNYEYRMKEPSALIAIVRLK